MLVNTQQETVVEFSIEDTIQVNEDQYFGFYQEHGLIGLTFRDKNVSDAIIFGQAVFSSLDDALIAVDSVMQIKEVYPGFDFRGLYGMPSEEQTLH